MEETVWFGNRKVSQLLHGSVGFKNEDVSQFLIPSGKPNCLFSFSPNLHNFPFIFSTGSTVIMFQHAQPNFHRKVFRPRGYVLL